MEAGEVIDLPGFVHLSIGQEAVPTGICAALDPAFCGRQGHAHDKGKELPDDEKAARPATCAPQATRGNHHGGSEETEDRDLQPDRHRTGHLGRPSDAQTGNLHSDVGGVGQQGHALDRRNSGTDDQ